MEYLAAEASELVVNVDSHNKKTHFIPRYMQPAIENKLISGVTVAQYGVLPDMQSVRLLKRNL